MKTCPNCHLESALRHGDEGDCVDALRASLDEALALAKENGERAERAEEFSVHVKTDLRIALADVEKAERVAAQQAEANVALRAELAEAKELNDWFNKRCAWYGAELERKDAALWEIDDACAADENVPYIQSLAQAALAPAERHENVSRGLASSHASLRKDLTECQARAELAIEALMRIAGPPGCELDCHSFALATLNDIAAMDAALAEPKAGGPNLIETARRMGVADIDLPVIGRPPGTPPREPEPEGPCTCGFDQPCYMNTDKCSCGCPHHDRR